MLFNNKDEIVESNVICPKCKSPNLYLNELWINHSISFEQINNKFNLNKGVLEPGSPYTVKAKCINCEHTWKLRKVTSIYDILK